MRVLYNKLDGDGIIDKGEFVKGLRTHGFRLANEDASLVFDMVDFNGDGMMAFDEFCSIFNPKNVRYSNERLKCARACAFVLESKNNMETLHFFTYLTNGDWKKYDEFMHEH